MNATVICPVCNTPRVGDDAFCEVCGYDFVAQAPRAAPTNGATATTAPTTWFVEVHADREYFERLEPEDIEFPDDHHTFAAALEQPEVVVGRRSVSRGIEPDVDLGGDPLDPGISHTHVSFVRADDGTYSVVDLDSTNGTCLNGGEAPIEPGVPQPVRDGDRVHIGAWTTITVRADAGERITEEVAVP